MGGIVSLGTATVDADSTSRAARRPTYALIQKAAAKSEAAAAPGPVQKSVSDSLTSSSSQESLMPIILPQLPAVSTSNAAAGYRPAPVENQSAPKSGCGHCCVCRYTPPLLSASFFKVTMRSALIFPPNSINRIFLSIFFRMHINSLARCVTFRISKFERIISCRIVLPGTPTH